MKILFVQYWYDFYGGIEAVNDSLASQFTLDGNDAKVMCLWNCGKNEFIFEHKNYKKNYISQYPSEKSLKKGIKLLLKLNLKDAFNEIKGYYKYKKITKSTLKKMNLEIRKMNPDNIIVSTPELIPYIPSKYINKTIMHLHLGFRFWDNKKKCLGIMKKYKDRVKKIVWLTPKYSKEGIKRGYTNSTYMYNPVRITSDKVNKLDSKKAVFVGRIVPEKRVDLLAHIFNEFSKNNAEWNLYIYGSGNTENIELSNHVHLMGPTSDVKKVLEDSSVFLLTSLYEGFPMVILEANECGVPTIAFDFEIATEEVIQDGKTGYIVRDNNEKVFIQKMNQYCNDSNLRKEMGKNAKHFAFQFKPEIVAKRWYRLFRGEI